MGLPVTSTPVKVTAVTATLAQFWAVVVGLNATSPATLSPAASAGSELPVTDPVIAWLASTPLVAIVAVVVLPSAHVIVAVRLRLPATQLAVVKTGSGEVVTVPLVAFVVGLLVDPERQLASFTLLSWIASVCFVWVSPGEIVADPVRTHAAPRGAACARVTNIGAATRATAAHDPMTRRRNMGPLRLVRLGHRVLGVRWRLTLRDSTDQPKPGQGSYGGQVRDAGTVRTVGSAQPTSIDGGLSGWDSVRHARICPAACRRRFLGGGGRRTGHVGVVGVDRGPAVRES